ncbi:unnamed protein product [Timema podura]|uniref:cAMP-dependent protein kinase n=1 Tax=Timema podura TaxID=61482 RepID=A0ABN7NK14_TIMPD|nr:unnamed protein product [Timema podura]
MEEKLAKHYTAFETILEKAKSDFDLKWTKKMVPNAAFKDFVLKKTLGTGSFGRVVLAEHDKTKTPYAIKIMEKAHIVKMKQVAHTISEIKVLDCVKFEFIVGLEFYFKDNVYIFLVMRFFNGGEMFSHLRTLKKFDEPLSKFYASQVIMAFEYLHYLGLIYRDLKPENILIDHVGYIKMTDLGFCKKIDSSRTYTLCGTPEYLAPEIILSQGYSKSVDWWALGVLIFEMCAGYPPFFARDPMRVYEKIVSGRFSCPSHFTRSLRGLLGKILQVDRSKRFGNLKDGTKDIKGHDWFKEVDWDSILNRKFKPSYVPRISDPIDTSNFDSYEEEKLRVAPKEEYPNEFKDIVVQTSLPT